MSKRPQNELKKKKCKKIKFFTEDGVICEMKVSSDEEIADILNSLSISGLTDVDFKVE